MIMFILLLGDIFEVVGYIAAVEDIIFPKSLIGTTIQDGGSRERKNDRINTCKLETTIRLILGYKWRKNHMLTKS